MNEAAKTAQDFTGDAAKMVLDVLLSALPVGLIYCLIFSVICIVGMVVMHKRRMYTRKKKLWNVLTKLHYPIWLLVFACCGFAIGFIASIKSSCDEVIDEKLHPALVGMVDPVQDKIIEILPPELADKPMTGQAIYDHVIEKTSESLGWLGEGEEPEGWLQEVSVDIQKAAQRYIVTVAIDTAIKRAGEKAGMAGEDVEFTLETFKAMDFSKEADEIAGKVTDAAKLHVAGFANGIHLQVLTYGGLVLLLLLIDPLVYYLIVVPRRPKPPAIPPAVEESAEVAPKA